MRWLLNQNFERVVYRFVMIEGFFDLILQSAAPNFALQKIYMTLVLITPSPDEHIY